MAGGRVTWGGVAAVIECLPPVALFDPAGVDSRGGGITNGASVRTGPDGYFASPPSVRPLPRLG